MTLPTVFKTTDIAANQDEAFALQLVTQSVQAYQLMKMRKLEESKVPTSIKIINKTITTKIDEIVLGNMWISFTVINNGPGSLLVNVNEDEDMSGSEYNIANGDTGSVDMKYAVIKRIYLKSSSTSAVKIVGKVGKRQE